MTAASPCPVCGLRIDRTGTSPQDFDCTNRCRAHDRAAWDTARAAQLAKEIEELLQGQKQAEADRDTGLS